MENTVYVREALLALKHTTWGNKKPDRLYAKVKEAYNAHSTEPGRSDHFQVTYAPCVLKQAATTHSLRNMNAAIKMASI